MADHHKTYSLSLFALGFLLCLPSFAVSEPGGYRRTKLKSRLGSYKAKPRLSAVASRFRATKPLGRAVVSSRRASARTIRRAPIRFIEVADPYTRTEGLAKFFRDTPTLRDAAVDVTANALRGPIPLVGARLLVVGSFATTSGGVRRALPQSSRAIEKFVRGGGTLVVLGQARADDARAAFLPRGLTARRGNATYDDVVAGPSPVAKRHPLWTTPNRIPLAAVREWVPDEPKWDYPAALRAVTHAFTALDGFTILVARDEAGHHPAVVEAALGKGRIVLAALTPDKLVGSTKEVARKDAIAWLQNLVAYADRVADGKAPRAKPDPRLSPGRVAVEARVRTAGSGVAIPGVAVTDGTTFVASDANGLARFMFSDDARAILTVVNPPGMRIISSPAHRAVTLVPSTEPVRVEFELAPLATPAAPTYTFAVISDVHLGARDVTRDGDTFRQRLLEVWAAAPRPEFIVSLGDVSAYARRNEFDAYMSITASTLPSGSDRRPVVSTLGNHDETLGPDRTARFEELVGPSHAVFHRGSPDAFDRFIIGYDLPGSAERRAWLDAALSLAPKPRNTFILQHHNPSRALIRLARGRVSAILSGDWHTSRVTREAGGVLNINTGPFNFGGLDQTPAGFRLVSVRGAAAITTRQRAGLIERRAEIVEPSAPASCRRGVLPILVSAYDSRAPIARASYRIAAGERELATGELTPFGNSLWRGAWECAPSTRLTAELTITVEDVRQNTWTTRRSVALESSEIRVASVGLPRLRRGPVEAIAPPLSLAWIASTGAEGGVSQPALAGDLVLVGRTEREEVEWARGALLAFDRATGEHRWTFHADSSIESSPAADDRAAYVTSVRGVLTALRLSDGKPLWKFDMNHAGRGSKYDSRIVYQSPVATSGAIITGAPQSLVRLSSANGRPDWFATAIGSDHLPNFARAVIDDRRLFVPSYTEGLHVLDLLSGATLWRTARSRIMATPLVVADLVTVIDQKFVRALSVIDGRERWRAPLGPGHHSAGAVGHEETVFVPDIHGSISAYRTKDGRKLWSTRVTRRAIADTAPYLRRESGGITATPVLSGGTLFVGGHDGVLTALDAESGRIVARRSVGSPIVASPTIAGEMLYVATQAGSLFAFRGTPSDSGPTLTASKNGKKRNGSTLHRLRGPRRPRS